jgi:Ca2+-binding EF-hand superfamily protein
MNRHPSGAHPARGLLLAAALLASVPAPTARADDIPAPSRRGWLDPAHIWQRLRRLEAVEMVQAIARGSQMGPNDGWFHPGQSRYGWKWLAARFDADKDGTITRKEFRGPAELFNRLDRDRDGVLTPADFDWSEKSPYNRTANMARMWFGQIDRNSNGRISAEEWQAFFKRLAKDKDYVTVEDLREWMTPPAPPKPTGKEPPEMSPAILLKGLVTGEIGSIFEGPAVGGRAPDFTLKTHDGKRTIRLSEYRGHKPVVLIFGSFT